LCSLQPWEKADVVVPFETGSDDHEVVLFDEVPASDPVHAIIKTILELVPVSHWSFARFKTDGDADQLLSTVNSADEFRKLRKQFILQRGRDAGGPSIAATYEAFGPYSSGLALLFADNRARFGILSMVRTDELGPFTSSEIRALTFALDAASDRLSELRLMESQDERLAGFRLEGDVSEPGEQADAEGPAAHYILSRDLEIVLAWTSENERRVALTPLQVQLQNRLPFILQEAVRELTEAWTDDSASQHAGVARPVPFLVVRTRPMSGAAGLFIGVTIERSKPGRSLTGAAARFSISPREVQVLALILDGLHLSQIAERLHITSSTVQDHIRRLLEKTDSHSRSEMTARILGWEQEPAR
jgi:DNA-binding CsgD family transcriptional regulator